MYRHRNLPTSIQFTEDAYSKHIQLTDVDVVGVRPPRALPRIKYMRARLMEIEYLAYKDALAQVDGAGGVLYGRTEAEAFCKSSYTPKQSL